MHFIQKTPKRLKVNIPQVLITYCTHLYKVFVNKKFYYLSGHCLYGLDKCLSNWPWHLIHWNVLHYLHVSVIFFYWCINFHFSFSTFIMNCKWKQYSSKLFFINKFESYIEHEKTSTVKVHDFRKTWSLDLYEVEVWTFMRCICMPHSNIFIISMIFSNPCLTMCIINDQWMSLYLYTN